MTRRPTPAELVAAPCGARLCLELALLSDPLAFVWQVADTVVFAMYWQEPDDVDRLLAEMPEAREAILPVAEVVLAAPGTAWWSSPLDLASQHILTWHTGGRPWTRHPTGVGDRLARWGPAHPGPWWSGPLEAEPPLTTRAVGHLGCRELMWAEECGGDFPAAELQEVRSTRRPRVHEVDGPDAWIELVERFPWLTLRPDWPVVTGRSDCSWWIPDWRAVAEVYDAVHLTVTGYLTTATRALDLDRRRIGAGTSPAATLLGGWNPDQTLWLTDVLEAHGDAERWVEDYPRPEVDSFSGATGWHREPPP